MAELSGNSFGEHFFRTLVRSMPGALSAVDVQGRQLFVNPAFCSLVGWSEKELLGQSPPFIYWAPEDASSIQEQYAAMRTGTSNPTSFLIRFRKKNNERFLVRLRAAPMFSEEGTLLGYLSSVEDLQQLAEVRAILKDRDHFIESVTRAVPENLYVYDIPENRNVYSNRHVAETLGFSPEDIQAMGRDFLTTLLHPEDQARLAELFARWETARDGQIIETEYRMQTALGDYRWFLARDTVFERDEQGRVRRFIGAAQDITARKMAEDARAEAQRHLQESELRYRLLADHSSDMISRHAPSGLYRDVSPASARVIGYTPHELFGRSGYELIHPDDRDHVFRLHSQIVDEKKNVTITFRMRKRDGDYIWVEVNARPILDPASGEVVEILAVTRDITDRKHIEEALRQSEELFRALVEKSDDGIALVEDGGKIRYLSPAANRILGYDQADLASINAQELVLPDDLERITIASQPSLSVSGGSYSTSIRARGKDGGVRHLEVIVTNHTADTYIQGFIVNFRDISDRLGLEDQLRQMQKMEAIGQLAGGIAHDFNNILTAIIGNVSLLIESTHQDATDRQRLFVIDQAARRAADLTHRLLGYSRRTALHLRPANLNRIIEDTLALLRPSIDPRIVYELHLDPELWTVSADAGQISQILTNVCLNSRDAMPKGGRLMISSSNTVIGDDYVRTHLIAMQGEYIRLTIADTGCGMSNEVLARVFEPFFTTKPVGSGTGLGLAMVYGIIKAHGGWVTCESQPDVGTRIELFMPRSLVPISEPSANEHAVSPSSPQSHGETILLVDDEPAIRMLGKHVLEKNGYRVLLAEDGIDAIESYREISDQVALVILDLTMPRLSGSSKWKSGDDECDPRWRDLKEYRCHPLDHRDV
ncbi:MAG: PAS domain S-box protein [Planctomycetes bacterium]|nr:PAS domain S-box protein [Planctomycetota bacterium]